MADSFADAVAARFSGAAPADDVDNQPEAAADADAENGRMFRQALKGGDNVALCEAIRRICGV